MNVKVIKEPYLDRFTNCFLVEEGKTALLADTGLYQSLPLIEKVIEQPTAILCTHGHWDHIGGHHTFQKKGVKLYGHPGDENMTEDLQFQWNALYEQFSGEFEITNARRETYFQECGQAVQLDVSVQDGDILDFGNIRVEVLETPGHSSGSVCYYIPEEGLLLNGDTVSGAGFFNGLPQVNDMTKYRASLERLQKIRVEKVCSCHSEDILDEKQYQRALREGLDCLDRLEMLTRAYLEKNEERIQIGALADELCKKEGKGGGSGAMITAVACLKLFSEEFDTANVCCQKYIL